MRPFLPKVLSDTQRLRVKLEDITRLCFCSSKFIRGVTWHSVTPHVVYCEIVLRSR